MLPLAVAACVACLVVGAVGGYLLSTHIHSLSVGGAAARAVTIPSGTIDAINAKVDGLGTQMAAANADLANKVKAAVDQAVARLAPPPSA